MLAECFCRPAVRTEQMQHDSSQMPEAVTLRHYVVPQHKSNAAVPQPVLQLLCACMGLSRSSTHLGSNHKLCPVARALQCSRYQAIPRANPPRLQA